MAKMYSVGTNVSFEDFLREYKATYISSPTANGFKIEVDSTCKEINDVEIVSSGGKKTKYKPVKQTIYNICDERGRILLAINNDYSIEVSQELNSSLIATEFWRKVFDYNPAILSNLKTLESLIKLFQSQEELINSIKTNQNIDINKYQGALEEVKKTLKL